MAGPNTSPLGTAWAVCAFGNRCRLGTRSRTPAHPQQAVFARGEAVSRPDLVGLPQTKPPPSPRVFLSRCCCPYVPECCLVACCVPAVAGMNSRLLSARPAAASLYPPCHPRPRVPHMCLVSVCPMPTLLSLCPFCAMGLDASTHAPVSVCAPFPPCFSFTWSFFSVFVFLALSFSLPLPWSLLRASFSLSGSFLRSASLCVCPSVLLFLVLPLPLCRFLPPSLSCVPFYCSLVPVCVCLLLPCCFSP